MFRKMRRFVQQLPDDETLQILQNATSGVLAVSGDDGYPYAVPVSFVFDDGHIYFHSALEGHKIDALSRAEKVSFCVIAEDMVCPEKVTTFYKSVIAFGRAKFLEGDAKMRAARLLSDKFCADFPQAVEDDIAKNYDRMNMIDITVEHMTGKEAIELTRRRK